MTDYFRNDVLTCCLLRTLAKGEVITQVTSTLENPAILDQLKEVVR